MTDENIFKRSSKSEFNAAALMRERSFIKSNKELKRRSQTVASIRGKPTMEIYRPPNVRTDIQFPNNAPKLNVHAKEFTMNHPHGLQPSKSSGDILLEHHLPHLQHSKSSGNILRHLNQHPGIIPLIPTALPIPLLHATSHAQLLNHHLAGMNFQQFNNDILAQHPVFSGFNQKKPVNFTSQQVPTHHHPNTNHNLKRSKSLGATDSQNLATKLKGLTKGETDLGIFSEEDQKNLKLAVVDPNQLPSRTLMDLVKVIMERVIEGIKYCEPGAKLCIAIIEREKNQTFLESLLNTCQQWYQERDKILRDIKAGDGTKFTSFMWFLTEMCGQLKRHQLKEQFENLQPEIVLLSILAKCCQSCVSLPIKYLSETECLFFVLTSIGRDLEAELPQQLEQLLASVRDGFLTASTPAVRRTLLQLIELHASNWQLAGSSVLYYYPRIK
ncbi:hypothetical protein WA026_020245 [Henosepilachna vigintioctopunctata]|uniref:MIF4G domain-containing protein n=1 Tax=Henosepilachna vigintioctopunctata TaxID=420089 RepID=A0AAW1TMZ3_9CUCU